MGRPAKPENELRRHRVTVTFTDDEMQLFQQYQKQSGLFEKNLAARLLLLDALKKVVVPSSKGRNR